MRREQKARENVEWRCDGQPECGESTEKRAQPPDGETIWRDAMQYPPSAQIENRRDEQTQREFRINGPRTENRLRAGRHPGQRACVVGAALTSAASCAGRSFAGCNVFRNDTSAVVSAGLRFFP